MLCLTGNILSNAKGFQLMLNKKDAMNWGVFFHIGLKVAFINRFSPV